MSKLWLLAAVSLVACSGGETAPEPKEPSAEQAQPKQMKKLNLNELIAAAEEVALVPSPAEMQKSLSNAGLSSKLSALVPADRNIEMTVADKDNLAVRTGVVLADLVLTVKSATKEEKVARLKKLKAGFLTLGGGEDIQETIKDLINQVNNEAFSDDDLLKEMDELSGVMVPELEYEAGDWVVPLIQAGSWLEGANLVSSAIIKEEKFDTASQLLRQPRVVEYFLKYVEREGREKAPDEVVKKLTEVLKSLQAIASKEKLGSDDVKSIQKSTSEVLSLL